MHFDVIPSEPCGLVVVEIPHAGVDIDEASARFTRIPEEAVRRKAARADSDVGAAEVWEGGETLGVTRIVARSSRYVIDLNTEPRLPTAREEKLPAPLRAVLVHSQCGLRWREDPLPREEIERRIRDVFEPYHGAVAQALDGARAKHGAAVLLSSHTFPHPSSGPDVVLGTLRGAAADATLRDVIANTLRDHGLSVSLEDPFPGGYALRRHADVTARTSAVQIEVARRLVTGRPEALALDADGPARVARALRDVVSAIERWHARVVA